MTLFFLFFTCVYFASGSKCGLSTPLTSGELAGGKLVLLIALHSSSLALENDGLSLTGGGQKREEKRGKSERFSIRKRPAQAAASSAPIRPRLAMHKTINPVTFYTKSTVIYHFTHRLLKYQSCA